MTHEHQYKSPCSSRPANLHRHACNCSSGVHRVWPGLVALALLLRRCAYAMPCFLSTQSPSFASHRQSLSHVLWGEEDVW
ncbi:uncharacterized protein YALI1_F37551g [Yarrowia lipolytica]|uniref:Uncharacterized protein n=1 Tax=Yarrowia lipolytica TaxID=4952 RepID=A0A1D8NQH7_YARLL|nr:hypothetical protein YALI1_F37551g [Yarrowia lipolytica]